ncbi:MAG: FAD-linked oxidase C-terminal domain-containing protein [Anaerolineae bacterium]|nr:MAG: FAD-linked oxidase C-terminal domain-containing protein [Anaerolineae bacterium]
MNLEFLKTCLGSENVSARPEDLLSCSRDASRIEGECLAVVWPRGAADLAEVVVWAQREGADLTPRGAGTGLCGGATPQRSIVVDLSRLTEIGDVGSGRKGVRVQAGVVIGRLNRHLHPYGLYLPVVPGSHPAATLGGMIATDASGMHAVRYGSMRSWVEIVTMVDGTGRIHRLSGEALEDVVGREGATGLIVETELKLTELPGQRSLTVRAFDDATALLAQRSRWLEDPRLMALEYLNARAAKVVGWPARPHLLAEFEGDGGEIEDLGRMADVWRKRDSLGPQLSRRGMSMSEDPQVDGEALAALIDWLEAEGIPAFGHLGTGIIHPRFRPGDERLIKLYEQVQAWGGRISGEHGIGLKKRRWTGPEFREEVRQLKDRYDPSRLINRGKLCS